MKRIDQVSRKLLNIEVESECNGSCKREHQGQRYSRRSLEVGNPARVIGIRGVRDKTLDPPALVVTVGATELRYHLRCLTDLHEMLKDHGDWMLLGRADEQKPAAQGTVEAWARSATNPVGGWYGIKGPRGRFATYVPPVMELLNLAEVEHSAKNNRMRAR